MKRDLSVKSVVIYWVDETMEITSTTGSKHVVPLDQTIHVTMIGYPAKEEKIMPARDLGPYMSQGYVIERIEFEEDQAHDETI